MAATAEQIGKMMQKCPKLGNSGAIQRHSPSHKLPKRLTMHETNQDLDTATEFPFIKKKKKASDTCRSNYTILFCSDLSKILLCILFKRIVTKQTNKKTNNHQKPTLQKNPHAEQAAFTYFTQMRTCDLLQKKAQASDWKPSHSSFVNFAKEQLSRNN